MATSPFSFKGSVDGMDAFPFSLKRNGHEMATPPFYLKGDGDGHLSILSEGRWVWPPLHSL